ncbi:hypothetical protein [uncultured Sneathiella sp.]|jgi:type IV secretory pathway VirB4 component|uniref:VirB4 family type IV secretion/conjugal transfer ATPase n=1 Tax=uncultured Sneathiella sp. TaxID=879315 RepID=UPI0030ED2F53|tara:strand:- start:31711 stop:34326 length:2616 start_codon:yes stop_codon:yes gene_type:complete
MITEELSQTPSLGLMIFYLCLMIVPALLAAIFLGTPLRKLLDPVKKGEKLVDHVLIDRVLRDQQTVRCTDGTLFKVVRIGGVDLNSIDEEGLDNLTSARKALLFRLGNTDVSLRKISRRQQVDLTRFSKVMTRATVTERTFWLNAVLKCYAGLFTASYRNTHYLIFSIDGAKSEATEELTKAVREGLQVLSAFSPEILAVGRQDEPSELLEALGNLLNPGIQVQATGALANLAIPGQRLAHALVRSSVDFLAGENEPTVGPGRHNRGLARFTCQGIDTFVAAVSIITWAGTARSRTVSRLLAEDSELLLCEWMRVKDRQSSEEHLKTIKQKSILTGESGQRKYAQMEMVDDALAGDNVAQDQRFVDFEMTIFVHGRSAQDVWRRIERVEEVLQRDTYTPIRLNDDQLPYRWLSILPPHWIPIHEVTPITQNVADLMPFSSPSQGLDRCDWGNGPVQLFHTVDRSVFGFVWHETNQPLARGHTFIIGPTGGGKTILINFLAASSTHYPETKVFIFDRGDASYITVKALGGRYFQLQHSTTATVGDVCRLNPFQLDIRSDMSGETRWLITYLRDHIARVDPLNTAVIEDIEQSVRGLASVERRHRHMAEFYKNLVTSEAKDRFRDFAENGTYGNVFRVDPDRPETVKDTLHFDDDCQIFGFEFEEVLNDSRLTEAILPYIHYRISKEVARTGCAWLMILDELKALLEGSERMVEVFNTWLDEARRKRGVIVGALQFIEQMIETNSLGRIRAANANLMFLPNPNGVRSHYIDELDVSHREFEIISKRDSSTQDLKRFVLVKRQMESGSLGAVVLLTDLGSLRNSEEGDLLCLFEGGHKPANTFRKLEDRHGYPGCVRAYVQSRSVPAMSKTDAA